MKAPNIVIKPTDWQIMHIALMTLLMIFFLILFFYYEKMRLNNEQDSLEKRQELVQNIAAEFQADESLKDGANVLVCQNRIKVTLPTSVVFDLGSADLSGRAVKILGNLASHFKKLGENTKILIEGHTDNVPIGPESKFSSNWELSVYRALSVLHFFVEQGVVPDQLISMGYGEYKTLYPNDTPEHRHQNRRIEIHILEK